MSKMSDKFELGSPVKIESFVQRIGKPKKSSREPNPVQIVLRIVVFKSFAKIVVEGEHMSCAIIPGDFSCMTPVDGMFPIKIGGSGKNCGVNVISSAESVSEARCTERV